MGQTQPSYEKEARRTLKTALESFSMAPEHSKEDSFLGDLTAYKETPHQSNLVLHFFNFQYFIH
jgi:hypothetical protein